MNLEKATNLAMQTSYAHEAVGVEINVADAGAFFLEGVLHNQKEVEDLMQRSGIDISPCGKCGKDVMCYPEGLTVFCIGCEP